MKKFLLCISLICWTAITMAEPKFPEIEGWKRSEETRTFNRDNLYDYINGAAELFLTYGFDNLHVKEYVRNEQLAKVEVYDHASPLNAFGMYSQERYQDGDFLDIGAQGYGGEGFLNFVKDRYYVKVIAFNTPLEELIPIATRMAENLQGTNEFPVELKFLPAAGKIPASEKFIAVDFMGLSFLNQAISADYTLANQNFSVFIIRKEPELLKETIAKYYQFIKSPQKNIREGVHEIKDPYNGLVTIKWEKDKLIGIVNLNDKKLIKQFIN